MHLLLTSALKPCQGVVKESCFLKRYRDTQKSIDNIQNLKFASATFIDASTIKIDLHEFKTRYPNIEYHALTQADLGFGCDTLMHQGIGFGEYKLLEHYINNLYQGTDTERIFKIGARTIPVNIQSLYNQLGKKSNFSYFELNRIRKYFYTRIFALRKSDLQQIIGAIDHSQISNRNTCHLENHFFNKLEKKYELTRCAKFYFEQYHASINDGTRGKPLQTNMIKLSKQILRKAFFN